MKIKSLPRLLQNTNIICFDLPLVRPLASKSLNAVFVQNRLDWGWLQLLLLLLCLLAAPAVPANPVTPTLPGSLNLDPTPANKVVVGRNNYLHGVYQSANQIWYTWSADGSTWSPPVMISGAVSGCSAPTIGVDHQGRLGVAFGTSGSKIYYTSKPYDLGNTMTWSTVSSVQPVVSIGSRPAIVGYRDRMHLVWVAPFSVEYHSFPSLTSPTAVDDKKLTEILHVTAACGLHSISTPSIAIARRTPCDDEPPIIRVAFLYSRDYRGDSCIPLWQQDVEAGVRVVERPLLPTVYSWGGNPVYGSSQNSYSTAATFQLVSLSLAANRLSGDFALAYSYEWKDPNGLQRICNVAAIPAVVSSGTPAQTATFLPNAKAHLDVIFTATGAARQFRVAYTPGQNSVYGLTFVQELDWTGGTLVFGNNAQKSSSGASGQALNYRRYVSGGTYQGIEIIYDYKWSSSTSSGYRIESDFGTIPLPAPAGSRRNPCLDFVALPHPNTWIMGSSTAFTLQVTNAGSTPKTGVLMRFEPSAGVIVLSATPSQESCSNELGAFTCHLGELLPGAFATVRYEVLPTEAGLRTNVLNLASEEIGQEGSIIAEFVADVLDRTRPSIASVVAPCGQTLAIVRFSEPMNPTPAVELSNYSFDSGDVGIVGAILAPDGRSVKLTLSRPVSATNSLIVSGLADAAGNVITPNPAVSPMQTGCPSNSCLVLTCPQPLRVECTSPTGTPVAFAVPFTDSCDSNVTMICTPSAGGPFPFGTTTVQCAAFDDFGNTTNCSFTITVEDTTPPVLLGPDHIAVEGPSQPVTYEVSAVDNCDSAVPVVCSPPSGSIFPMGDTAVNCTGTDQSGNQGSYSFPVSVQSNPPLILRQPISLTVTQGQSATFSVMAAGTPPLTYQWRRDGAQIPGATDSAFTVSNVQLEAGESAFSVVITSVDGSVESAAATLTVLTIAQAALISGEIYFDLNGSGTRDAISEYGLPRWSIQLVPVSPAGPALSTTTDVNGRFSFGPLPAGTFTLSAVHPSPWFQTYPEAFGIHHVTLTAGDSVTGKDFGCKLPVRVPQIEWQRSLGGYRPERALDGEGTQQTADGGYVVGGDSQSPPNFGGYDFFVSRLDAFGNQLWARNYGDGGNQNMSALKQTSDGGFILIGTTAYIVRLNADGDVIWDGYVGGVPYGVIETVNGDFLVCGYGGGPNGLDAWIARLDSQGNKLWERFYGGPAYDGLYYPVENRDGSITISGESESDISAGKDSPNYGGMDYWLVKIDAAGNKLWDRSFGGDANEQCQGGLGARSDGSVVMCGFSISGTSGNKTAASFGNWDVYLVCVDTNGNKVWDNAFGGIGFDGVRGLQITKDDGVVFAGSTSSQMSGNKVSPNFSGGDAWLVKTDANGDPEWDLSFGGSRGGFFRNVTVTADGGLILTGGTTSNDGNVTVPQHLEGNIWVVKLAPLSCTANALTLVAATADCAQQKITANFSAPLDPATALQPAHYTLSGGAATVQTVSFGASTLQVVVDVPGLLPGVTYTLAVHGLGDDCGNAIAASAQLTVACPGEIHGKIFSDGLVQDCVEGSGEFRLANWPVKLEPGPRYSLTDKDGNYSFTLAPGAYTVSAVDSPRPTWIRTCPEEPGTYTMSLANGQIAGGRDFAFAPLGPPCPDLRVTLTAIYPGGLSSPCCGAKFTYRIDYENQGNQPSTATIGFAYPILTVPNRVTICGLTIVGPPVTTFPPIPITPPTCPATGPSPSGLQLFGVPSLPVGGFGTIFVDVLLCCDGTKPCTPQDQITLNAHAVISPPFGVADCAPGDNTSFHSVQPCCSSDPNDCTVTPKGCGPEGLVNRDHDLTYLVQFQNLGGGAAHLVVVRNVLDADLDESTVEVLGSSHPNFLQRNGRELTWIFPNIGLASVHVDEVASHGYVKFRVRPRANAPVGTVITNSAEITFDINAPITTITTTNTITEDPVPRAAFTVVPRHGSAGHTNDFLYTGGTVGAQHRWSFGPDAVPATSLEVNPAGVIFTSPGPHLVALETRLGDCVAEPAVQVVTVGQPVLGIARTGLEMTLYWSGDGFRVEEAESLTPPVPWRTLPAVPLAVGGGYLLKVPVAAGARFYRLAEVP